MYLFIFGKDPEISKIELSSYLKKSQIQFQVKLNHYKYCILDFDSNSKFEPSNVIKTLGGTIRIAKLLTHFDYFEDSFLEKIENYSSKFNFSISSINISDYEYSLYEYVIKNYLKKNKVKATYKNNHPKGKDFNILDPGNFFSWGLHSGFEIIIVKDNETYYYFETSACTNPKVFEERDLERPKRFITHATSPRMSAILVNCLGLIEGSIFVDPFCGTGTLLIEALLRGYKVIGIDNDPELIISAKENIEWAKNRYEIKANYDLIGENSQNAEFTANACCFEPYMGPFLRKPLSQEKAFSLIKELTSLYSDVFKNLAKNLKPNGSIFDVVCILPFFETREKRVIGISNEVFENYGFSLAELRSDDTLISENPLNYNASSGNFIGRKIYFLKLESKKLTL